MVRMLKYTTLCYIEKDSKYLMLYRNKKKNDLNKNKWIGVGGHLLENESKEECLVREVKEETGLTLLSYTYCGRLHFYIDDIEEICYVYTSSDFIGELIDCDEGNLKWIEKSEILELALWPGDYLFLNKILNNELNFDIDIRYKNNQLIDYIERGNKV